MQQQQCSPLDHRFRTIGFSWTQLVDGKFLRYILQDCLTCQYRDCQLVHRVNSETPVCTNCLGQDYLVSVDDSGVVTTCNVCGCTDVVTLNPVEEESQREDSEYE